MDEIIPDCQAGRPCLVPPLDSDGQRIIELRGLILSLHPTIDPGTVCKLYGATLDDLRLLAVVENELRTLNPEPEDGDHGERH